MVVIIDPLSVQRLFEVKSNITPWNNYTVQMESLEKTVVLVSLIMIVGAIGFVIYPHLNFALLESSTSNQIDNGMPSQYSKVVNIKVERTLQNQPNVSEEAEELLTINTDDAVARSEVTEVFKRKGIVVDTENVTRYTDGDINRTYTYPPKQTINNSGLPVIDRQQLNDFNKTESFGVARLSMTSDEFTGLLGADVQRYIASQEVESVEYRLEYDIETGRLLGYEVSATSDTEDIQVRGTYEYNLPGIESVDLTTNNETLTYETESEVVTVRSVLNGSITNVNAQNGQVKLEKGEDIRDYELFEVLRVTGNSGTVEQEHLLTDDKVIISER